MIFTYMVGIDRLPQFRVAVNSRCGRRCFYCRPSGEAVYTAPGVQLAPHALLKVAGSVRRMGIDSIKLTGGDPALYRPLVSVAEALKRDTGFEHVEVISRHPRIGALAVDLAAAGIDQVNISLDTVDAGRHAQICGVDDLPNLLVAIESCVAAGLIVKVNTVVMAGINDHEIHDVIDRCANMGVTTVKLLDVIDDLDQAGASFTMRIPGGNYSSLRSLYTPFDAIIQSLQQEALSSTIRRQGDLGHPMTAYHLPSGVEVLVKDSRAGAWYGDICTGCVHYPCHDALMALRLTADLRLQYCLLRSENVLNLSELIVPGAEAQLDLVVQHAISEYSRTNFTTQWRKSPTLVRITLASPEQANSVSG